VITPFDSGGRLDLLALDRHCRHLVASGVHGLILCSTLGEAPALDEAERLDVLATGVQAARGTGVPVVAALVESAPARRNRFLCALPSIGADGLLLFPPLLYRPNDRELVDYLRSVLGEAGLPTMMFNKPSTFGCDFSPRLAEALAGEPLLQAVKEAAELTARTLEWRERHDGRLAVFAGDEFAFEALTLGAAGFIAGLGNMVPAESAAFYELWRAGSLAEAVELYRWLCPLYQLDVSVQLVQNIKLATSIVTGLPEFVRSPRQPLDGEARRRVEAVVTRAMASRPAIAVRDRAR